MGCKEGCDAAKTRTCSKGWGHHRGHHHFQSVDEKLQQAPENIQAPPLRDQVADLKFLLALDHCPRQDLAQQQHHLRLAEPRKKIQVPHWQNLDQGLLSKMLCYRMGSSSTIHGGQTTTEIADGAELVLDFRTSSTNKQKCAYQQDFWYEGQHPAPR